MDRLRKKSGMARLGFAQLLKFSEAEARRPESAQEVPIAPVEYVGSSQGEPESRHGMILKR